MGDALKDIYTAEFLHGFSAKVHTAYKDFDSEQFVVSVLTHPWDELPLKARMHKIAEILGEYLPKRFEDALRILFSIDESCNGFPYLFFPDFAATYGQQEEYWELSMNSLERFTQRSSSEFAIRPFLLREPERVMEYMLRWSLHPNEHVRRFSSEGCRPRLPWGIGLPIFKKDPSPVFKVLERLKADPSLYVRKSVANNLNDIAKDNPDAVLRTAQRWIGHNPDTDWILRRGCRTLIRKANPEAMTLFGYTDFSEEKPLFKNASLSVKPDGLQIGDSCKLHYSLDIVGNAPAHIRLEYGIDFIKSNGKPSLKLFLLSDKTVSGGAHLSGTRLHSFAELTTRRHYPGVHRIALLLNGQEIAQTMLNITGDKT
ncbi:DNA alkylation repair protein [Desulfosporosinus nitroreducens]|uniref:DNA alkylation repair protein n=1 Tax=Desulfosporosinus nitroreducens TaxID=2018668 RepID=UPI00207CF37D|nr:DNA alkylation repair protein [Desulfosporosinus nitroreducens]MCO1604340.1 DNA alkylation repair protein [Desulfosporosinus nitroreducens]